MSQFNPTLHVLDQILAERKRQDSKWGDQRKLSAETWLRILGEEFGEACKAANDRAPRNYRKELVQIAAVAVAAIESHDAMQGRSFAPKAEASRPAEPLLPAAA